MKVCIFANRDKDKGLSVSRFTADCFTEKGVECIICDSDTLKKGTLLRFREELKGCDLLVTVGGDGTLIRAARDIKNLDIPLIGVNMGTIGYLTEINVENIPYMAGQIVKGDFFVEKRMMAGGTLTRGGETIFNNFALNDIVINKNTYSSMVSLDVYVDDQLLTGYDADGIIISTPTGSTAYNLSAGGPLMVPSASMMVITPICAHILSARSVVVPGDSRIKIKIKEKRSINEFSALVFDGAEAAEVKAGDEITITRLKQTTKLFRMSETSFYKVLQRKLSR